MEIRDKPKLKRVTRIDSIPIGNTSFDEQGFLHDTPIVTSTGIFEYRLPDGGVRRELRLPEHVFDKKSLASYAGKPVIITHEAGSIDKNNVMKEIVGTILSEGFQDGSDVRCKIVIHDIDKVKKIPYRELSLGYNLDLIEEPGEWNGEPYDAVQTNIVINHLALVATARAGDKARLNIDGSDEPELKGGKANTADRSSQKSKHLNPDNGIDGIKNKEGGKENVQTAKVNMDSIDLTPEELLEAVKSYKAAKAPETPGEGENVKDGAEPVKEETPAEEAPVPGAEAFPAGQEKLEKDGEGVKALIPLVEQLLEGIKAVVGESNVQAGKEMDGCGTEGCVVSGEPEKDNKDSSDDQSKSMNADSADDVFRQRLSICRMGDILGLKGLEDKTILDGKKAIIAEVIPDIRLDGKDTAYVDAAYDLAVANANKRKDISYQKRQMAGGPPNRRMDGNNESMAMTARQKMIEREGGNE